MKRGSMKRNSKKNKGFTLIELLAVIIILGVLMIIAIPSVTEYIQSSRKNAYVTTASQLISGATTKINAAEIPVYDTEATYYIPTSCISLEKGGDSPFGEIEAGYIVVTYDGTGYDYYFTVRDSSNMGILLTSSELLDSDRVKPGINNIDTGIAIEGKTKIYMVTDCASSYVESEATSVIPVNGSADNLTETNTRDIPYYGRTYSCSNGDTFAFYEGGSAMKKTSSDSEFSSAGSVNYTVSKNGKTVTIDSITCNMELNPVVLNKKYSVDMGGAEMALTFYENGSATMITPDGATTELPAQTFIYGMDDAKTSGVIYDTTGTLGQIPVLDNGNSISAFGTTLTKQN